jgi:hypothetical protein
MNKLKKNHQYMHLNDTGAGPWYPDPDAGGAGADTNVSMTAGDSPFAAGAKEAIIYSIYLGGVAGDWTLETHAGDFLMNLPLSATASTTYVFGPQGIRIPEGFRLNHASAPGGAAILVTYDVV